MNAPDGFRAKRLTEANGRRGCCGLVKHSMLSTNAQPIKGVAECEIQLTVLVGFWVKAVTGLAKRDKGWLTEKVGCVWRQVRNTPQSVN
jgi:hypothetical protein